MTRGRAIFLGIALFILGGATIYFTNGFGTLQKKPA